MISLNTIKDNPETIIARLALKNFDAREMIASIIQTDEKRRELQFARDKALNEAGEISKNIGMLFKQGNAAEADKMKQQSLQLKETVKQLETELAVVEAALHQIMLTMPNVPHESVPRGKSADDNLEIRRGGSIPVLEQKMPHWDLISKYNIIDFELGTKITGAGFPVYMGKGAKLQRALIGFFLDEAEKAGYYEVQPPLLVNEDSGFGTGQLPDKDGQMYAVPADGYYLIPTAEVPVTNLYRDVILKEEDLPVKNVAYTACFRREAGSWGAHVRGLNRLHQFDKVEIVQVQKPENSYQALNEMVQYVESLIVKLGLPYRILKLCGGDISFTSAMTFDFEVFSAAQERWLEVSSVSNFESFQANRLKLRYRDVVLKKNIVAHTLNGSALALPRILAAILENYQTPNGIVVPDILKKYTGFNIID